MIPSRNPYPTDVSDEEWAFVAPYLMLLPEDAGQRTHSLREVFNGLRWIVRAGAPWRMIPNDLPPWWVVYQQTQRWIAASCFTALVDDLRLLLREAKGRNRQPSAAILDSRTLQSTPESGGHAGYDGAKRRKGSKVHAAVDTLGNLLTLLVTPANEQDRAQVGELAQAIQARHRESCRSGFRGPRLYRRCSSESRKRTWHSFGSDQTSRSQAWLCPVASPMGS